MPEQLSQEPRPANRPRRTSSPSRGDNAAGGWRVLAVQAIACVVILLIIGVFRLVGGTAFAQLRDQFNASLMNNSLLSTMAALFDNVGGTTPDASGEPDATPTDPTGGETASTTAPTQDTPASDEGAAPSTEGTTAALPAGGDDLTVSQAKVWYAPDGTTFAPLRLSQLPAMPLAEGTVTSAFGYREHPTQGGESFHQGLDIGAAAGTPIAAMYYGVVSAAGQSASYGNYVRIDHGNGLEVLYAHCSELLVQKGAVVRAGETVAKVGSTGDSTGPHLHIEMRLDGLAYDPADVLPAGAYA